MFKVGESPIYNTPYLNGRIVPAGSRHRQPGLQVVPGQSHTPCHQALLPDARLPLKGAGYDSKAPLGLGSLAPTGLCYRSAVALAPRGHGEPKPSEYAIALRVSPLCRNGC